MPLKASLGALRQFIDSSSLEKIYFLDLFKTDPMSGGFFDTQGRFQFVTAGAQKTVQLDVVNDTGDIFEYTGPESDQAGLSGTTVLLKYQDGTTAGCNFLTNGNVAATGVSRASTNLGNLQLDSSNNHTFTGQTVADNGYVDCELPNYTKELDMPGAGGPTPYTFDLYAYDGISDGTNVYIGGSYESNPVGFGEGGFLTKLNQFGSKVWDYKLAFIPKHIAFDETGANLVVAGNAEGPTLYEGFVQKFDTGTGATTTQASIITNNVSPSSPDIVRIQSLDVESTGNIVVGGNYRSSGGVAQNGFIFGLDSSLVQRYMKKLTGTMPATASLTVKNVSQNESQGTLCIAANNNDTVNNYGIFLNVPYDGTSPGTGSYSLAGTTTTYTNTTDVTAALTTTSYASGNITLTNTTGPGGSSTSLSSSTFSFSKLEL